MGTILETLGEFAPRTRDPILLTEAVRHRLARVISARYRDADHRLRVITLDPACEDRIRAATEHTERGLSIRMSPHAIDAICTLVERELDNPLLAGRVPVVLVSPEIRPGFKQLTAARLPRLVVLSYHEIAADTRIESLAVVGEAA